MIIFFMDINLSKKYEFSTYGFNGYNRQINGNNKSDKNATNSHLQNNFPVNRNAHNRASAIGTSY